MEFRIKYTYKKKNTISKRCVLNRTKRTKIENGLKKTKTYEILFWTKNWSYFKKWQPFLSIVIQKFQFTNYFEVEGVRNSKMFRQIIFWLRAIFPGYGCVVLCCNGNHFCNMVMPELARGPCFLQEIALGRARGVSTRIELYRPGQDQK